MNDIAGVQILVRWGDAVLVATALTPARTFVLGTSADADLVLPLELLGRERHALVSVGDDGAVRFFVPCLGGVRAIAAQPGKVARAVFGAIEIELEALPFMAALMTTAKVPWAGFAALAATLMVHGGALAASAYHTPRLAPEEPTLDASELSRFEFVSDEIEHSPGCFSEDSEGGTGVEAELASGSMGALDGISEGALALSSVLVRPPRAVDVRARIVEEPAPIGLPRAATDRDAETRDPLRRPPSEQSVAPTIQGKLWGDYAELDAAGEGALGLSGVGLGGGGKGEGVGLGTIGTIGRGAGAGSAAGFGDGALDHVLEGHEGKAPAARLAGSDADAEAQRVIRSHLAGARLCYQRALARNPALEGRVALRFSIGPGGSVEEVVATASELNDKTLTSCVERSLANLAFSSTGAPRTVRFALAFDAGR